MKLININELQKIHDKIYGDGAFDSWLQEAETHLNNIRKLDKSKRNDYWKKHNIWTKLYSSLSELSGNSCWYTEAPENSSEWEIDHYRPKSKSKNNEVTIREDGYWWLSYSWKNFRLVGSLANKLRKDRFKKNNEVYGKGIFFPLLDINNVSQPEDNYCMKEEPFLIDPIDAFDITLISFDKNGEVYPTYSKEENDFYYNKAIISIQYYGLEHTPLQRGRKKIWEKCHTIVDKTQTNLKTYINDASKRNQLIRDCYNDLIACVKKDEPYTMVVRSYISEKIEDESYKWLKNINKVIGN
ncbi:MAG: hypothetical protein KA384_07915 [Leptotrichiaceae bacterium]|jgi:hypothetical protein|nr:hypothetical protein [Leptotrichiaceae bacterium]